MVPWMQMGGQEWPQDVHKEIKASGAAFTTLNNENQWVVIVNSTPPGSVITGNSNKAAADRYRAFQDRLNTAMRAIFQIAAQGMQETPFRRIHIPIFPIDEVAGEYKGNIASVLIQAMVTGFSCCASFDKKMLGKIEEITICADTQENADWVHHNFRYWLGFEPTGRDYFDSGDSIRKRAGN